MAKKHIVIILLVVFLNPLFAQESVKQDSLQYKIKKRKNEIGVNMSPVLIYAFGGKISNFIISFSYKRLINNKGAFRSSINLIEKFNNDQSGYFASIKETDSISIKRMSTNYGNVNLDLNLGYEVIKGKSKIKIFYGADLLISYYKVFYYSQISTFRKDSTIQPFGLEIEKEIIHKTDGTFQLGVSPFSGIKIPLLNRFLISMQSSVYLRVGLGYMTGYDASGYEYSFNHSLDYFSLINDVSLIYRF